MAAYTQGRSLAESRAAAFTLANRFHRRCLSSTGLRVVSSSYALSIEGRQQAFLPVCRLDRGPLRHRVEQALDARPCAGGTR